MRPIRFLSVIIISLLLPQVALSESQPATIEFKCNYEIYASLDGLKMEKNFSLRFLFEPATEKAVLIGNMGMSDVTALSGSSGITFLELLSTGVVQSTTIVKGTLDSVHSRHTILGTELVATQYYGTCAIIR